MPEDAAQPNSRLAAVLAGVIWDMDGVLIDSMEYQFEVWRDIFAEYGVDFDRANFNRHFGTTNLQTIRVTLGDKLTPEQALALSDRKQAISEKESIEKARLIPGVLNWLQYFKECAIPQAVASSNTQNFIEATARRLEGILPGWHEPYVVAWRLDPTDAVVNIPRREFTRIAGRC